MKTHRKLNLLNKAKIKTTGLAGGMHHAFKAILLAMPQGILKSLAPANISQQPLKWLFI